MREEPRLAKGAGSPVAPPSAGAALKAQTLLALSRAIRPVMNRLDTHRQDRLMTSLVDPYVAWRSIGLDFVSPDGIRIQGDMRDLIVRNIFFRGMWEPALRRLLDQTLRPGDVFIDAGSNFGYFSIVASRLVGSNGAVIAIEASPSIFGRLQRHIALNRAANVTCRNVAVSGHSGRLKVFLASPNNPGSTTTVENKAELMARGAAFEAEVEALPLDMIVPSDALARTSLIKVDVEGAEASVLASIVPFLSKMRHDVGIVVEFNRDILECDGHDADALLSPFRTAGFGVFRLPDQDGAIRPITNLKGEFNKFGLVDVLLQRRRAA